VRPAGTEEMTPPVQGGVFPAVKLYNAKFFYKGEEEGSDGDRDG
jgi:hypothetical protein